MEDNVVQIQKPTPTLVTSLDIKADVATKSSDCLKERSNIGNTQYVNVCTGEVSTVSWGSMDYTACGVVIIVVLLVVITVGLIIKDLR